MKLTQFALRGVRGVSLEHAVDPHVPLVITGPPGSGKTTLLEALVASKEHAGAYGAPPSVEDFGGPGLGRVVVTFDLDLLEQAEAKHPDSLRIDWELAANAPALGVAVGVASWFRSYDVAPERWKLEYFDAHRRLSEHGQVPRDGTLRTTKSPSKYNFVRRFLETIGEDEASLALETLRTDGIVTADRVGRRRSTFQEALSRLVPTLRWDGVERRDGKRTSWFVRPRGPRVELGALTDGERAGLLVAATWVALGLERSLVLVDQAELHIHPEQQPAFFEGLASLMRRGQLVVSTTSPAILRNPSGAKVLVLPAAAGNPA